MTGSRPTTSCDRLRSTASARRSANECRGSACGVARHAAKGSPSTSAAIASGSSARDAELGRRATEERRDQPELVGVLRRLRPRRALRLREERRDLDGRGRALRDEALRRDASTRDRIGAYEAGAPGRHDDACAQAPEALQLPEGGDRLLERREAVAETRRVLEALVAGESREPRAERHDGRLDVVRLVAVERPRRTTRDALRGERPEARRLVRDAPARSAAPEVDVAVGARAARVRRRPQVAEEPQLLERRLELRARLAPLDPLERAERRLDGGPLPLAGEVRAEARAELPRAADVERHPAGAPEHVDAGARRRARDERALRVQSPRARSGELDEVGQRAGAPLLGEPDQDDEDLRRRAGVRQRAVARLGRDAEEVRERREPDATRPLAEEPSGEPDGVHDGSGDAPARQVRHLAVEEREVEPRVVRDERGVSGERDEAAGRHGRRAERHGARAGWMPVSDATAGRQRDARVDERLERVVELERANALRADLADPRGAGREPGRLEVDDDEVRVLEEDVRAGRVGEPDRCAAPGETGVTGDDVVEQRARERRGRAREREEHPGRLLRRHGAAAELDQLDQPVGGVERQLHRLEP